MGAWSGVCWSGESDLCKLSIQHATTVLTQSAAASGLTLLQPNFGYLTLGLLNHLWDHKQEIEFEWPYFMIHVVMTNVGT